MARGLVMMLMCTWACTVGGDYGAPRPFYEVLPAGPSKQHKWAGHGYSDYLPLAVPKPYIIPKWVPHTDPTFTAIWVSHTPTPIKGFSHGRTRLPVLGFGSPNRNSVAVSGGYGRSQKPATLHSTDRVGGKAPQPSPRQAPLLQVPAPQAAVPPAILPTMSPSDPLATFAAAPVGVASVFQASRPATQPVLPSMLSFLPPKANDILRQSGATSNSVVLLVVCTLLTVDLTVASYNNNYVNLIIRPASHSRSFKWLGPGDIDNMPLHMPRPLYIPRWLPKSRPEYVAKWVPTMPSPHAHQPHAHQPHAHQPHAHKHHAPKFYVPKPYTYQSPTKFSEFGAPKVNSVVQPPNSPSYGMVPPSVISPALPIASSHSTGYAPPYPGDIISGTHLINTFPATVGVSLAVAEPSPREYNPPQQILVIPETGIRSQASGAHAVPSFEDLVYGAATVHFSEFSAPQPSSVITFENASDRVNTIADHVSDSALTDGTLRVTETASPTSTAILYGEREKGFAKDDQLDNTISIIPAHEDNALVLIKKPSDNAVDANFPPQTTAQILDGIQYLEASQDSSGTSQSSATVVSLPLEFLQRDIFARENDVVFVDVSQSLNFEPNPEPDQNTELSVYLQVNQDFRPSQPSDIDKNYQTNEGFRPNPEFNSSANFQPSLEVVSYENIQTNPESIFGENADFSLEYDENSQFNFELGYDDNFQINENRGQDTQFNNKFKTNPTGQSSEVNSTPVATSRVVEMALPGLVAPPASPPVMEGRSFSHHSILPLTGFIPKPVSVPLAPSALTLNRPGRASEVRQARGFTARRSVSHLIPEASQRLPLGTRVQLRPSRRHYPSPVFFG